MSYEKYQPSNGTEGWSFVESHCMQCFHCDPDPNGEKQCNILLRTLIHNVKDKEYPSEWIYDENDQPTCTQYKKWDWGNDGDPDDPDNPNKLPIGPSNDPNQVNLFPLYPTEKDFETRQRTLLNIQKTIEIK